MWYFICLAIIPELNLAWIRNWGNIFFFFFPSKYCTYFIVSVLICADLCVFPIYQKKKKPPWIAWKHEVYGIISNVHYEYDKILIYLMEEELFASFFVQYMVSKLQFHLSAFFNSYVLWTCYLKLVNLLN